ncbi:MAG: AAA family ATPase [Verrucomicrobia bacterium]|nr:AAA family ATPase [Verrucomicrobiota bacterium]
MLERIEQIQGIGLLHDANGKPFKFQKATLIYADNGRGKTTLASVMRSLATGDTSAISSRATVDAKLAPKAILQLGSGHRVTFQNGAWSQLRPELLIFDSDFIERNVHSGGVVNTDHRKSLLEFALGESAVAARNQEEIATNDAKTAGDKVRQLTAQLSGYHQGSTLDVFEKLPEIPDADAQIAALQTRVTAAAGIAFIAKRPVPAPVLMPSLDVDALFSLLGKTMEDIQEDAERIVRAHVTALATPGVENWLSQGQSFVHGETCPYCGQVTTGLDLVRAYRTHFNAAYADLKDKVSRLHPGVLTKTDPVIIENFAKGISDANEKAVGWEDHVSVKAAIFDEAAATKIIQDLRELLVGLALEKQASPTVAVGNNQNKSTAGRLWQNLTELMQRANQEILAAKTAIEAFRTKLSTEKVDDLQRQILRLQLSKQRHTQVVRDIFGKLVTARNEVVQAERQKKTARDKLNTLMSTTLSQFEKSINALLLKFGAAFSIEKMAANFRGGSPRSEYGLALRGKSIQIDGAALSFATALSEGDKRTLAFAFFVASTLANPKLGQRIVVIDDPMCSLDLNRKQHTQTVLRQIFNGAEQLIVLAHDPFFLRDVRDSLMVKNASSPISVLQLRIAQGGYSDFDNFDVDKECESPYFRHHRMLADFINNGSGELRHIAKAIRPALEGYLHRRFPGLVPRDMMFGQVIAFIKDTKPPEPICHAKCLVDELQEINDYAGQFHHDTNPGNADTVVVVSTELQTFAVRALNVIHKGTP